MPSSSPVYPRPDFERPQLNWTLLNGPWDFLFDDEDVGLDENWHQEGLPDSVTTHEKRKITVPFVFQTPASGIDEHGAHEVIWYERSIPNNVLEETASKKHNLLRFGAVDYEATIWVNGLYAGAHRGGHVPFDINITEALRISTEKTARLTVRVRDSPSDLTQPRGKQYWAPQPESIFYTPSSGIWQSVWLETVPSARIADSSHGTVLRSNDIENGELHAIIPVTGRKASQKYSVEVEASFEGVSVGKVQAHVPQESDRVSLDLSLRLSAEALDRLPKHLLEASPLSNKRWRNGLALWSPEHPQLYTLSLKLYDASGSLIDEVRTTTGMRSITWQASGGHIRLNGEPYFQALVLDQGYWPTTLMTPPTADSLKADIEMSKKMGFNGCRKHQKVEDPIFLYWADRLGYLVWGEIANAYQFDKQYVERFDQEWIEAMKRDINHPSIVAWTPVNESWGYPSLKDNIEQRNHIRSLYYMTKTLDPTRPINDNCGWEHVCTDLTTYHDYSDATELTKTSATMKGILDQKAGRDMFVAELYDGIPDAGASHKFGAPVLCTEFGGVSVAPAKDDANAGERDWGYTTAEDPQDLLKRIENLVMGVVRGGHCCGFVYTQLTDIEQEVNGLYSYDRREKLDSAKVKAIMDGAQKVYYEQLG
ncbi:glycoside hydrolase family 2 multidomain protein [Rhizodiscina lignyota]|uniref:Glycoside hydrolase family 2 multidomain protein n=1 Tax=Rhizodiscina lignyota TaxID=1504668 RepID=A0A9P4M8F8_9PEZI|nr:glycoside hydrolase family 2 multidomain protein [Rhizodiscina lignyota]